MLAFRISWIILIALCSCSNNQKHTYSSVQASLTKKTAKKEMTSNDNILLSGDSLQVNIDGKKMSVFATGNIIGKPYQGIYEVGQNGAILKKAVMRFDNHIIFTTFIDLGMGYKAYLYAFKPSNKKLLIHTEFKEPFIYSSAGIFLIDRKYCKIFSIGKPQWYGDKKALITPVSIFSLKQKEFSFLKNIYEIGDQSETGDSLLVFYKHSLANNAIDAKILPEKWWSSFEK